MPATIGFKLATRTFATLEQYKSYFNAREKSQSHLAIKLMAAGDCYHMVKITSQTGMAQKSSTAATLASTELQTNNSHEKIVGNYLADIASWLNDKLRQQKVQQRFLYQALLEQLTTYARWRFKQEVIVDLIKDNKQEGLKLLASYILEPGARLPEGFEQLRTIVPKNIDKKILQEQLEQRIEQSKAPLLPTWEHTQTNTSELFASMRWQNTKVVVEVKPNVDNASIKDMVTIIGFKNLAAPVTVTIQGGELGNQGQVIVMLQVFVTIPTIKLEFDKNLLNYLKDKSYRDKILEQVPDLLQDSRVKQYFHLPSPPKHS